MKNCDCFLVATKKISLRQNFAILSLLCFATGRTDFFSNRNLALFFSNKLFAQRNRETLNFNEKFKISRFSGIYYSFN